MKKVKSWWLPSWDTSFQQDMRSKQIDGHQIKQRELILNKIKTLKNFKPMLAIDIGANVGFWSRDFCKMFDKVLAYEPMSFNLECLEKNVKAKNYILKKYALGNETKTQDIMYTLNNNCGSPSFHEYNLRNDKDILKTKVQIKKLDDELDNISEPHKSNCYMKLDVQGHEKNVLQGGEKFIKKYRPIITIEISQHFKRHKWGGRFNKFGYMLLFSYKKEFTYVCRDRFQKSNLRDNK